MTQTPPEPGVRAQAGPAGAAAGAHGEAPDPPPAGAGPRWATEPDPGKDPAYGVTFRGEYEPGGEYEPALPPPAETQHEMGLHPAAAAADRAAVEAAGSRQAMQGDEGPHVDLSRQGGLTGGLD